LNSIEPHNEEPIQFSVVIPAYNAAATIVQAINSCLQQTYPPLEIIVVNDASTDSTEAVIKSSFGEQVHYTQLTKNGGGAVARNTGLNMAKGNYVAFLDADDTWHNEKLFIIKNIIESKPGIHLLFHPYTLQDLYLQPLPNGVTIYKFPFIKLLYRNTIAPSCVIIANKHSYRFNNKMRYTEDFDLWLRIGYSHKIYFIPLALTRISRPFLSPGGTSSSRWKMRKGELLAYTRLVKLNPLFILLLPFLYTLSLLKYVVKMIVKK